MMEKINGKERKRLARELVIGAPVAGLLWLLILRVFLGYWSFVFPLLIIGVSLALSLIMLGPDPAASWAFRLWKGLVFGIDWLVTRVVCLFLYFLIFTPLGWILRLLRVDLLSMKTHPEGGSYWRKVSPPRDQKQHYFRQY